MINKSNNNNNKEEEKFLRANGPSKGSARGPCVADLKTKRELT